MTDGPAKRPGSLTLGATPFVIDDDQGSYRTLDSPSLIETYRQWVNPKVNVYCIQVGGYTNSLMPEYGYRSTNLCGWTGKELVFADAMNRTWDEVESREPGQH